jgi:hypothetical protein
LTLLGANGSLQWKQQGSDVTVTLPGTLPGKYAYAVKIAGAD